MKCVVCDEPLSLTWTDQHGIGCCLRCGMDYGVVGYNDRTETECLCNPELLEPHRAFWEATGTRIPYEVTRALSPSRSMVDRANEVFPQVKAWMLEHRPQAAAIMWGKP